MPKSIPAWRNHLFLICATTIICFFILNSDIVNARVVYFPVDVERIDAEGNHLGIYRNKLEELQLPSFLKLASRGEDKVEAYRLMVVDAYGSVIIVQIVNHHGSTLEVDAFQNGKTGGGWRNCSVVSSQDMPNLFVNMRFKKLSKMLNNAGFWEAYYFGWGIGLDTQIIAIEGIKEAQHHFFTTSDPVSDIMSKAVDYFRREIGCFK